MGGGGGGGSNNTQQEALAGTENNILNQLSPTNPNSPLVPLSNDAMALFNKYSPVTGSGATNPQSPANSDSVAALDTLGKAAIPAAQTGQLTPGLEQYVQNYVSDAESGIAGKYASLGLSDSTMAAQDKGAVEGRGAALRGQMAEQLSQLGISAETSFQDIQTAYAQLGEGALQTDAGIYTSFTNSALSAGGLAGSNYSSLAQQRLANDQQSSQEIGAFASTIASVAAAFLIA